MKALFFTHSGLRYLVIVAGLVNVSLCVIGLVLKREFTKQARLAGSVFVGLMHTQVLLGLVMVLLGTWYPALAGHLATMLLAAVLAQVLVIRNKKAAKPGYLLPLIGIGGAMVLIVAGIYSIGRTPFGMTGG